MALSETGHHRLICNHGCEIAYSVWQCMSEETWNGMKIMQRRHDTAAGIILPHYGL